MQTFSTRDVEPRSRLRCWNQRAEQVYSGTCVDSGSQIFNGRMQSWSLGDLEFMRTHADPARVCRRPVRQGQPGLILHIQTAGQSRHRQCAIESELGMGDLILSDASESYRFDLSAHELSAVQFPREPLAELVPDLDLHLRRRIAVTAPGSRMFRSFVGSMWNDPDLGSGHPQTARELRNAFFGLLAILLRQDGDPDHDIRDDGHARRLVGLVEDGLNDPDFGVADIARAAHCSKRSVQLTFARMGTTPTAFVLKRRLQRAAETLREDHALPVTDVAFRHGFNDSAYFARCFKREFGISPTRWRKPPT